MWLDPSGWLEAGRKEPCSIRGRVVWLRVVGRKGKHGELLTAVRQWESSCRIARGSLAERSSMSARNALAHTQKRVRLAVFKHSL